MEKAKVVDDMIFYVFFCTGRMTVSFSYIHVHQNFELFTIPFKCILREKSLAIYFENSQFRRNRTFNFIVSSIFVDKCSRLR